MVNATSVRAQIRTAITELGSSATRYAISVATDKWGDETETPDAGTAIVAVAYEDFPSKWNLIPAGNLVEGDTLMIVMDSVTVSVGDKITYNAIHYDVHSIEAYEIQDIILAKQLVLKRRI